MYVAFCSRPSTGCCWWRILCHLQRFCYILRSAHYRFYIGEYLFSSLALLGSVSRKPMGVCPCCKPCNLTASHEARKISRRESLCLCLESPPRRFLCKSSHIWRRQQFRNVSVARKTHMHRPHWQSIWLGAPSCTWGMSVDLWPWLVVKDLRPPAADLWPWLVVVDLRPPAADTLCRCASSPWQCILSRRRLALCRRLQNLRQGSASHRTRTPR